MTEKKDDAVTKALDKLKPIVSKLGFGGLVGYISGMATKTVGRAVAILGGMTFIALQSAAYMGYLNINWGQIKDSAVSKIDTDADGELTIEDAKTYWHKLKKMLTYNVPSAGGFSAGFLYGVTYS